MNRRDFLTSTALAAPAALVAASPVLADDAAANDARDVGHDSESWDFDSHPWAAKFLIGLGIAIDAVKEANAQGCDCPTCCDLTSYGVTLQMYANCVESDQFGDPCVEIAERELREVRECSPNLVSYYAQQLAKAKAAGRYALPVVRVA
jgi:hypothetical protein